MKTIKLRLLLSAAIAITACAPLSAQPWMRPFEGRQGPVKLQEVVDAYDAAPKTDAVDDDDADHPDGAIREGHNYLFDRWKWYWAQHLDASGNMISPLKTYQEWEAYKSRIASGGHAYAKATANSASNWAFFGTTTSPGNGEGVGRVQTIAFHPTDSNQFWIGSAGGGAWKTTTAGASWTNMTSSFPVLGVACITYNPLNPQVLYICTGDRDATDNSSLGVMKTTDGGATWTNITASFGWQPSDNRKAYQLVVNPQDTATLLLATSVGIYKSYNSGATWTNMTPGAGSNYSEVKYYPGDSNVVYATRANAGEFFRSSDAGNTYTRILNVSGGIRLTIATTPANRRVVKLLVSNSGYGLEGIYRSSDTGKTFTKIFNGTPCTNNLLANTTAPTSTDCGGQGWYDLTLAISPTDTNLLALGGTNAWYSADGGVTWKLTSKWASYISGVVAVVHADKHFQAWNPLTPKVLYEGNDGGVFKTNNVASANWTDLTNGLAITQFYRIATANYANYAIGGAQDNGSFRINGITGRQNLNGGDGMNCEMDPVNSSVYYTSIYYGTIYRNSSTIISKNIPGTPQGDWITPYKIHPRNTSRIIAGYYQMYLSDDQGDSWSTVSPEFIHTFIQRVAFAPTAPNTFYFVKSNGVYGTFDKGLNWNNILGSPGGTISDIIADRKQPDKFYVTYSGYGGARVAVYDTTNGWQDVSGTLPAIPVNCITQDTSNATLYVGTDVAVWYKDTTMTDWALWNNNLPAVEIRDLDMNYGTDEIWAGTYGRGIWKSPRRTFPPPNGVQNIVPLAADVIRIVPNPATGGAFDIQTENAALIGQPATVLILDMAGRTVWTTQQSFSTSGSLHVQTSGLAHGAYMVSVTGSNGLSAKAKMSVLQ